MPDEGVIRDPYKDLKPMIVEIVAPGDIDKHILVATVKCQNPLDCIDLSARIIQQMRLYLRVEPVVKILQ